MGRESRLRRVMGLVRPDGAPARALPTVAFGYCFGTLHAPFVASLLAMREHGLRQMARGEHVYVRHQIPQAGLYIDHNRNRVVEKFLATDAEWLLQVDTDIEFPPDLPERLLAVAEASGHKIVAASVPLSWAEDLGQPLPSCGWMMTASPGVWACVEPSEIPEQGIEVDGVATAVIMIHRSVLEAIADQVGQMWFFKTLQPRLTSARSRAAWEGTGPVKDREYVSVGEDLAFSMRAHDAGFRCWLVKLPGLRHHKTIPLTHDEPAAAAERVEVRA